jgi:hypothetical protein
MHNANVVFGVGVFEDESCFQQVLFLLLFWKPLWVDLLLLFTLQATLFEHYVGLVAIVMLLHIDVPSSLVVKTWRAILDNCLFNKSNFRHTWYSKWNIENIFCCKHSHRSLSMLLWSNDPIVGLRFREGFKMLMSLVRWR